MTVDHQGTCVCVWRGDVASTSPSLGWFTWELSPHVVRKFTPPSAETKSKCLGLHPTANRLPELGMNEPNFSSLAFAPIWLEIDAVSEPCPDYRFMSKINILSQNTDNTVAYGWANLLTNVCRESERTPCT